MSTTKYFLLLIVKERKENEEYIWTTFIWIYSASNTKN